MPNLRPQQPAYPAAERDQVLAKSQSARVVPAPRPAPPAKIADPLATDIGKVPCLSCGTKHRPSSPHCPGARPQVNLRLQLDALMRLGKDKESIASRKAEFLGGLRELEMNKGKREGVEG